MKILARQIQEFLLFIRKQSVVSLAIGIIIGGAVTKLVSALVSDIINPVIGIFLGKVGNLNDVVIPILSAKILIGNFISTLIDFIIIVAVVYFGIKKLRLDKLDAPKE